MKKICLFFALLMAAVITRADVASDINNLPHERGQWVIYEMNVGMMTTEGTFAAAQERLADLKELGVDVVWLMPIYPRGGGINSPYAATDFKAVKSSYGTVTDLKAFVARAHELGMLVWLDWVPNHTATNATWVTTHPEYYKKNGNSFVHPNNYGDVYQLDYQNAALVKAMNDCLKFWIDQADVDGFRCDYISSNEIPSSYWTQTIPEIKQYKQGKDITFLGEADIANSATRLKYVGFDYDYAWNFQSRLASFANGTSASTVKSAAQNMVNQAASLPFGRMLYLTNHDQNWNESKTLTDFYGDNRYSLTVLTFTLWGMPLIYNGQEVGGNQKLNYFQDTKINWSNPDMKMQNTIKALCALKHSVPALKDSSTGSENAEVNFLNVTTSSGNTVPGVLAYTRKQGTSEVLVLLNFGSSAVSSIRVEGITPGTWTQFISNSSITNGINPTLKTLQATSTFTLSPRGYQVLVLGDATPVRSIEADATADAPCYDLQGRRVALPSKGIYVKEGKLFLK